MCVYFKVVTNYILNAEKNNYILNEEGKNIKPQDQAQEEIGLA